MLRPVCKCLGLLSVFGLPLLAAPMCVSTTLDVYEALGSGGCQIGGLVVKNFTYSFVSGSPVVPDTAVTVTPIVSGESLTLDFTSPDFTVSGSTSTVYLLAYTWDPGDIRSLEDILNANSPVPPGFAQITTVDCRDAAFIGSTCPTSTDTLIVNDDGITLNSPASVSFSPPVGILGIRNTIQLDGNGASSEIGGFENRITLPEPSAALPLLLLAPLLLRRLRLKRT